MSCDRFSVMVVYGLVGILVAACTPTPTLTPTASVEPSETPTETEALTTATSTPEPTPTPTIDIEPSETVAVPTLTPEPTFTPTDAPRPSLGAGPFRAVAPVDDAIPGGVRGLHITPDGRLWLYSDQAVARLQDDETWSVFLPEYEGVFAGIDPQGRVWIINDELTQIAAWDGQGWTQYGEESGWVPSQRFYDTPSSVRSGMHIDSFGRLWLATARDVRAFDGQQWFIFGPEDMGMARPEYDDISMVYVIGVNQDRVWVGECNIFGPGPGDGQGVRWFDGEWHGNDSSPGIDCVTALNTSHDEEIWIGMTDKLWQTDPYGEAWTSIDMPEEAVGDWNFGYPIDLKVGSDGDLWAIYIMCGGASCGGQKNLYHIENGTWTPVANTNLIPDPMILELMLGLDGTPWLFMFEGIDRVVDNRREPAADLFARFITQDSTGQIWFIAEQDGQNWLWTLDGLEQ